MGYDFILTHLSGPIICYWCFWLQNFARGAQPALLHLLFSQGPCSFSSCTHDQQPFTCGSSLLIQIVDSCLALWLLLKSLSWCLWRMPANKRGRSDRKKTSSGCWPPLDKLGAETGYSQTQSLSPEVTDAQCAFVMEWCAGDTWTESCHRAHGGHPVPTPHVAAHLKDCGLSSA